MSLRDHLGIIKGSLKNLARSHGFFKILFIKKVLFYKMKHKAYNESNVTGNAMDGGGKRLCQNGLLSLYPIMIPILELQDVLFIIS